MDAIAATDVDDDGRAEVIAQRGGGETLNLAWLQAQQASARGFEEHAIGEVADHAKAHWWRNPGDIRQNWEQQEATSRSSLNSLSAADMNDDGRPDLVMGEHRGALRLSLWRNLGGGRLIEQLVDEGVESHFGARTVDLDGDGDREIVSIGWDAPQAIHACATWHRSIGPRGRAGRPKMRCGPTIGVAISRRE
ncbi:VCBS repeat-containing protein [Mesorhizobium sp.]|uniref:FG-GAP repeat domain-containing protein n=1 Tax=Mesorhizobium sp. TaxID=1871066 RepID=UPI00257AA075|nr:VCBS repeat-containing protein [Mesorhizobium sp.]